MARALKGRRLVLRSRSARRRELPRFQEEVYLPGAGGPRLPERCRLLGGWDAGHEPPSAHRRDQTNDIRQSVLFGAWIHRENETLERLHAAGALVPRPLVHLESALLMSWIGDE